MENDGERIIKNRLDNRKKRRYHYHAEGRQTIFFLIYPLKLILIHILFGNLIYQISSY